MGTFHLWLGELPSANALDTYLDQRNYLNAWALYDHGPAGGDAGEPDAALRCGFCKEVGLDTYDEDRMVYRHYRRMPNIAILAKDLGVDAKALAALYKKQESPAFNAAILYEDKQLKAKGAAKASTLTYLGTLPQDEAAKGPTHYLWVGSTKYSRTDITKTLGIAKDGIADITFHFTAKPTRLDEMLILQVKEMDVAERMILKVDAMKLSTANAILDVSLNHGVTLDGSAVASALGIQFIGTFDAD